MGGNGSFLSGITNFENGRMYKTVFSIGDNIKILETKNPKASPDGKRLNSIHLQDHKGLGPHWHPWKNGGQVENEAYKLTNEMKSLINKIINFKK